jgi:hypothetical protein
MTGDLTVHARVSERVSPSPMTSVPVEVNWLRDAFVPIGVEDRIHARDAFGELNVACDFQCGDNDHRVGLLLPAQYVDMAGQLDAAIGERLTAGCRVPHACCPAQPGRAATPRG